MESNPEKLPIVANLYHNGFLEYNIRRKGNCFFIFIRDWPADDNIFSTVEKAIEYFDNNYKIV